MGITPMVAALGLGGDGSSIMHPSRGLFDVLKSPYFGVFFCFTHTHLSLEKIYKLIGNV